MKVYGFRFRGGLVFEAQKLSYHSTLGSRVIKKKKQRKHLLRGGSRRRSRHPSTLHPTPNIRHPIFYTLHTTPYILHPAPYTLHPSHHTLHPTPYTLHPTPNARAPFAWRQSAVVTAHSENCETESCTIRNSSQVKDKNFAEI